MAHPLAHQHSTSRITAVPIKATCSAINLAVRSSIRVLRAWSLCLVPGLGLEQELVALPEAVPVEMLRLAETLGEPILVALPCSESVSAPRAPRAGLVKVPRPSLLHRAPASPLALATWE
jgi:hypothetical protein